MSIEQLMNEPVTSVSKKATNLFLSPAAVAVIRRQIEKASGTLTALAADPARVVELWRSLVESLRPVDGDDPNGEKEDG